MDVYTKENGKKTICMDEVSTPGAMVASMRVSTRMTRSTDLELMCGLMAAHTQAAGKTGNSMVRASIASSMAKCVKASGMRANVHTGLMR